MRTCTKKEIPLLLATALSLSVGWGIRGNFGHEYGAMIPGALAAMAAVLLAGRDDWWRRIPYFALFGALGWSFGGSISYMQVIGYTHSGHSASVLYGFACLFVIGFLWAAMGGAGTALPACLTREQLTEFFVPLTSIFAAWCLQDLAVGWFDTTDSQFRHTSPLYWYDTDWLSVLVAIASVLITAAVRRRFDSASALILHMAIGWWIGFLLLVVAFGWRMTPPRGDNWAGCVGMVAGLWLYLQRRGFRDVLAASLVAGFFGGFGFATATLLKLVEVKSGLQTNWHSVLEQTYGWINGLGIAIPLLLLRARTPRLSDSPPVRPWTDIYAVVFVLIGITYVNLVKNPAMWVKANTMPAVLLGLTANAWFNLAYLAMTTLVVSVLIAHRLRPLPLVPASNAGKGQLLYLLFLWWVVVGNFERALVAFAPQRLITEGTIFLNAVFCSFLVVLCLPSPELSPANERTATRWPLPKLILTGLLGMMLSIGADWAIVRALYGDQFAGHAALHIRFGPNATVTKEKPAAAKPHP
jgi:hypothetical protein